MKLKSKVVPKFKKGDLVYYQDWEGFGQLSQVRAIKTEEWQPSMFAQTKFDKPTMKTWYVLDTLLTRAEESSESATVGSRWENESILVKNAPPHLLIPWVFAGDSVLK
jgi:hypothetical protein